MATADTIKQYFVNILQRDPTAAETTYWVASVDSGALSLAQARDAIATGPEATTYVDQIIRIYQAAFGRQPDVTGMAGPGGNNGWVDELRAKPTALTDLAGKFVNSQEWKNRYGDNTVNDAVLQALYQNVLGRAGSAAEIAAWKATGQPMTQILIGFSNSAEFQSKSASAVLALKQAAGNVATADLATVYDPSKPLFDPAAGTGQTYTLTVNPDSFTGTPGADTFVASEATLSSADVLDGATGIDTLRYASSGAAAVNEAGFSAKNIEIVQVTSDATGGTVFDVTGVTDVTTLKNDNSSQSLTLVGTGKTVALEMNAVSGGNTVLQYKDAVLAGTADAQTVTLNGVADNAGNAASSLSVGNSSSGGTAGVETLNLKTTGNASKLVGVNTGATTVNVSGDKDLSIANVVAGAKTIDASTFTGNLTVVADSGALDVTVKGGKGADTADFSLGFGKNDSFDGGDGVDTIGLTQAVASGALGGTLKNVEQLNVTTGGTGTIDMDKFAGITKVIYDGGLVGATDIKNAVSGLTVEVDVNDGANGNNLTVALKTDGTADVVNVDIDRVFAGNSLGTVDANDAETVNITADDDTANASGTLVIANLKIQDATKVTLAGDAAVTIANTIDLADPTKVVLAEFDASKMTDNVSLSGTNFADAGSKVTFGSGDDVYNIDTSNGADTITLGAGKDTVVYTAVAQSAGGKVDTIADFKSGEDKLSISAPVLGVTVASQFAGNFSNFGAAQGALVGGTTKSAVFDSSTNTLWVDADGNGTLDANDLQVKLTGVTSLTAADLSLTGGVTFTANTNGFNTATAGNSVENNAVTATNDTINATVAQLAGSTVDGLSGTDVLNVTATAAAGEIADLTGAFTNVETVNLASSVEGVSMDAADLGNGAGQTSKINGQAGTIQSLTINTGSNLSNVAISNIEALTMTGAATMTLAQHNGFATITAAGGTDQITLTTSGTVSGNAAVETYVLASGNDTFTVGAAGQSVNVASGGDDVLNVGGLALTGTFTGLAAADQINATNGVDFQGATGITNGILNLTGNASMTATQHAAFAAINGSGTNTVTVNGAGNITGAASIESYNLGDTGRTITLGANLAQNVNENVNGVTHTLAFGTGAFTGTVTGLDAADDIISLANGANIAGVNAGASLVATNLTIANNASVTMTEAQYNVFNGGAITAGAAETLTFSTATSTAVANANVENYVLAAAGNDVFQVNLANAATTAFTVNVAAGGSDRINLNNVSIDAAGTAVVTVSGFTAGAAADQISSMVNGTSIVTGAYTTADAGNKITGQATGNVIEIHSLGANGVSIAAPTNDASVLASLNAVLTNGGTVGDIANGSYTLIGYNGTNAHVYQITIAGGDGTAGGDDVVELIGTLTGIGADAFTAANII